MNRILKGIAVLLLAASPFLVFAVPEDTPESATPESATVEGAVGVAPDAEVSSPEVVNDLNSAELETQAAQPAFWSPPRCSTYRNKPCSPPGAQCDCEWVPGEPGFCICESSGIWQCY